MFHWFDGYSIRGCKTYALLHEDAELALIFNIDELLAAVGRVRAIGNSQSQYSLDLLPVVSPPRGQSKKFEAKLEQRWTVKSIGSWARMDEHRQNIHVQLHFVWLSVEIRGLKE